MNTLYLLLYNYIQTKIYIYITILYNRQIRIELNLSHDTRERLICYTNPLTVINPQDSQLIMQNLPIYANVFSVESVDRKIEIHMLGKLFISRTSTIQYTRVIMHLLRRTFILYATLSLNANAMADLFPRFIVSLVPIFG